MPGKILDHTATSRSVNTLSWAIDLTDSTLDIFAESDPNASSGSSILLYALIGAGVILAGLVLWMFMRKQGSSESGGETSVPPADAAPPGPPPAE